jgi:hypothetical protein
VDLRHGKSTGKAARPTRHPGSSVLLLLDRLEDPLLGNSDPEVEATAATANTGEEVEAIVALRRGNNPEVVTEEEATDMEDMVHLPEAQLLGSNRMQAMALQAWTATAFHHLLRRLVESRHHRLPAISRRPLRLHHSSGLSLQPLEECVERLLVLASGVLNR